MYIYRYIAVLYLHVSVQNLFTACISLRSYVQLAAPTASSESVDTTGLVYVIFGKAGGWGAAVDLSEDLNGDDGFVAVGAVAGGHLG